jgi:MFS family permease
MHFPRRRPRGHDEHRGSRAPGAAEVSARSVHDGDGRAARRVQGTYYTLTLGNTLAASFIWGINTLFLLDAGLTNLEAFAANAFFSLGMFLFEIPTGVVADTVGRRASYLLGTLTLAATTALYWLLWVWESPFWAWAIVSILLGLGFTFFSGAVDAWLVDALQATGYRGSLEAVFGRAVIVGNVAMLGGSVLGGVIAQLTNLGVPFLVRAGILVVMFVVAAVLMHDLGFSPERGAGPVKATRTVLRASVKYGLGRRPVRWLMLTTPFTMGVTFYAFYALQPYLLELWGDEGAYSIAGLAAALLSGAGIVGGLLAPWVRRRFHKRTSVILLSTLTSALVLVALFFSANFWVAIVLIALWGVSSSIDDPVHRAYLNDMIPSKQRATVLSFDSLLGSAGSAAIQPVLGRTADLGGYGFSMLWSGLVQLLAVPFVLLSRAEHDPADTAREVTPGPQPGDEPTADAATPPRGG